MTDRRPSWDRLTWDGAPPSDYTYSGRQAMARLSDREAMFAENDVDRAKWEARAAELRAYADDRTEQEKARSEWARGWVQRASEGARVKREAAGASADEKEGDLAMGRRSKTWDQAPSVDDPGRASAIRDHSYTTSNGTWQLPKDSEVDREIARLADQMAAELEITDAERGVVAGEDAVAESQAEERWAAAEREAENEALTDWASSLPRVPADDEAALDAAEGEWVALDFGDDEAEVEA